MKKKLLLLLMILTFSVSLQTRANADTLTPSFKDVPTTHWAYQDIEEMVKLGYLKGMGNGVFAPEKPVSKIEFIQMMSNLLLPKVEYKQPRNFKDTSWFKNTVETTRTEPFYTHIIKPNPKNEKPEERPWYYNTLRYVMENKLLIFTNIDGYDKEDLNKPITRYQMAHLIINLAKNPTLREDVNETRWQEVKMNHDLTRTMPDVLDDMSSIDSKIPDIGEYKYPRTKNIVRYSYINGFIKGMDAKGNFKGKEFMTRAQASAIMNRIYKATKPNDKEITLDDILILRAFYDTDTDVVLIKDFEPTKLYDYPVSANARIMKTHVAGKLSNGKPITEENIQALLMEIKQKFPKGTHWGDIQDGGKVEYRSNAGSPDEVGGGGCNAWSSMVFSVLYGKDAPYQIHRNFDKLKTGDIVMQIDKINQQHHSFVVIGTRKGKHHGFEHLKGKDTIFYMRSHGNVGNKVSWNEPHHDLGDTLALLELDPNAYIISFDE